MERRFTSYTFKLRWRDGMTSVAVLSTDFEGTIGTTGPIVGILPPPSLDKGVYVTFFLPSPSEHPLIDGTLHLKWTGQPVLEKSKQGITLGKVVLPPSTAAKPPITTAKPPATAAKPPVISAQPATTMAKPATAAVAQPAIIAAQHPVSVLGGSRGVITLNHQAEDIDEAEHLLEAAISQLPDAQKQQVLKARGTASVRAMHPLPSTGPARQISVPPAMPHKSGHSAPPQTMLLPVFLPGRVSSRTYNRRGFSSI